jgi:energy-coupling factor transport system substrate-specific component
VASSTVRIVAAAVAALIVVGIAMLAINFDTDVSGATTWAYVGLVALGVAFVVYAALEYVQTKRFDSITRQFDTRTLVIIPIAIALNIILGQAVGTALRVPIYLDSIGTILVGALAGPIPGALTGLLANTLWTFVVPPPFHNDYSAAFGLVAVVIGLMAGALSRFGWMRPRRTESVARLSFSALVAIVIIGALAWLGYIGWQTVSGSALNLSPEGDPALVAVAFVALAIIVATIVGLALMLFTRRDQTVAYVVVGGVVTGIIAAVLSAPISANVFGGVTGAGTDFLVAALRQAGADIQAATLGQGLISDPIDKVITFSVVYVVLGAMATRTKARFPQGERLVEVDPMDVRPAEAPAP